MQVSKFKPLLVIAFFAAAAIAVSGSILAAKDGPKPGWGWGDQNNEHTGPPGGPSVHPVFGSPGDSVHPRQQ